MLRRCTPSRPFCSALLALRRRPPLLQPRRAIGRHVAGLWQGVGPAPALIAQSRPAGPAMQPTAGRLGLSRPAGSRLRRSPPLQPAPLPPPPPPPPPPALPRPPPGAQGRYLFPAVPRACHPVPGLPGPPVRGGARPHRRRCAGASCSDCNAPPGRVPGSLAVLAALFTPPPPSPPHFSGHRVVIVTSGAVGAGAARMGVGARPKDLAAKQALAAVGQVHLMRYYDDFFGALRLPCAQANWGGGGGEQERERGAEREARSGMVEAGPAQRAHASPPTPPPSPCPAGPADPGQPGVPPPAPVRGGDVCRAV